MKSQSVLRVVSLLVLLASLFPVNHVEALPASSLPPVDMFQLPWDQGIAWMAIDGIDNGRKRPESSSHNYKAGGAIDFAPRANMVTGEDTSNFWVTAAAAGLVVGISGCHVRLAHDGGWITEYQFLGNIQVKLGDAVNRNQRLGIIADGVRHKYCPGYLEPNVPHVHFMLRPTLIGAALAGWQVKYNSFFNLTTFTRDGKTVGLFKPLMNAPGEPPAPSPTAAPTTPSGPFISTQVDPQNIEVGGTALVTVRLNNVPPEGYTSAEFTCTYDASLVEAGSVVIAGLFGTDPATAISGPQGGILIVAIAGSRGNKAAESGVVFTFEVRGLQTGQTTIDCKARVSKGDNTLTDLPSSAAVLTVLGLAPTPTLSPVTDTPVPAFTPTSTSPAGDWLTFTNLPYGFEFNYPPQSVIADGRTDNFARIDLPFAQGTNLREKYLEVPVVENVNPCQSPLATNSILETTGMVVINGISFLKQTGGDGGAGHLHQWVAYSTSKDNACVSLDFILHSLNPGNFPTPPPVFDYAAESAVFEQIVSTYMWLDASPTATPTAPSQTPDGSSTSTPAPLPSPTAAPISTTGTVNGQVFAGKPVTVSLYADGTPVAAVTVNVDGTFSLTAPAGLYALDASASGFLGAQGAVTILGGSTVTLPPISLPAGDIDGNDVIDQFDAMTIGMNYNTAQPSAADLNNDGIINVLDLELLAGNYRKTGPVVWQ